MLSYVLMFKYWRRGELVPSRVSFCLDFDVSVLSFFLCVVLFQKMDYFCATAVILYSIYLCCVRWALNMVLRVFVLIWTLVNVKCQCIISERASCLLSEPWAWGDPRCPAWSGSCSSWPSPHTSPTWPLSVLTMVTTWLLTPPSVRKQFIHTFHKTTCKYL